MYILIVHSHQDNIGQMDLKRYDDKNAALSDTLAMIQRWSFHDTDNKIKTTEWMTNTKQAIGVLGRCDRETYTLRGEWPVLNAFEQIDIAVETDLQGRMSLEARILDGPLETDDKATRIIVKLEHIHFAGNTAYIVN